MSDLWRCEWCGNMNEAALGLCECGTQRYAKSPVEGPPVGNAQFYRPKKGEIRKMFKGVDTAKLRDELIQGTVEDIREASNERGFGEKPRVKWVPQDERHMAEFCVFDIHLAKLSWGEETGTNYDNRIAEQRVDAALDDLLQQARSYSLEKILLPWGNDFFHYDTLMGTTTHGTPMDRDSRYQKMFRLGRSIASRVVRRCAEVAPVDMVIVPGNHDEISSFTLGEVLDAEFKDDPRVSVNNSPSPRKYYRYGSNLIGYCHGHDEPHAKLPIIMAQEVPSLWSQTFYREFHVGHLHHSKRTDPVAVNSHNGVKVRIIPSLSGTDAWHAKKGYNGELRGCEAFIWNHDKGLRANLFHFPQDEREAA